MQLKKAERYREPQLCMEISACSTAQYTSHTATFTDSWGHWRNTHSSVQLQSQSLREGLPVEPRAKRAVEDGQWGETSSGTGAKPAACQSNSCLHVAPGNNQSSLVGNQTTISQDLRASGAGGQQKGVVSRHHRPLIALLQDPN